jgi:hypothetical protein
MSEGTEVVYRQRLALLFLCWFCSVLTTIFIIECVLEPVLKPIPRFTYSDGYDKSHGLTKMRYYSVRRISFLFAWTFLTRKAQDIFFIRFVSFVNRLFF